MEIHNKSKLENMAINDVLPLKVARCYAIANVKRFFGAPGHQRPKFDSLMVSFTFATLFGSHQHHSHVPPSIWQSLVGFCLLTSVCNAWQQSRMQNLRRVRANFGPILTQLWTKFVKFWDNVGDPSYFPSSLPDYLGHISFRRYLPLSLEVVKNQTNVKDFGPQFSFLGGGRNDQPKSAGRSNK